jgi:predicted nuclease of restriction endonuclease-like (RecB) superfamily
MEIDMTDQNQQIQQAGNSWVDAPIEYVVNDNDDETYGNVLFERLAQIIENRKMRASYHANAEITLMYWEVGYFIKTNVLDNKRAEYGKRIVATLSQQLVSAYGNSFEYTKIRRMASFAKLFPDINIVAKLSLQLSWSHFIEILPLKSETARLYYANEVVVRHLGVKELRRQIKRKAYERREIANSELDPSSAVPFNVFKDPYLLDMLGLKDNYLEADLEKAILTDLEAFILEFGHGFTFVERQKRMIVGGEDIVLDLLFFHRVLRRLVAVELKLGVFKAAYKSQMELYLQWLNRYERQDGEEAPIGLILCASANREKIELLEMDKAGIAVAEYWTHLPPKAEFENKIREILSEAQERLERRKQLGSNTPQQIDHFLEQKDEDDE